MDEEASYIQVYRRNLRWPWSFNHDAWWILLVDAFIGCKPNDKADAHYTSLYKMYAVSWHNVPSS